MLFLLFSTTNVSKYSTIIPKIVPSFSPLLSCFFVSKSNPNWSQNHSERSQHVVVESSWSARSRRRATETSRDSAACSRSRARSVEQRSFEQPEPARGVPREPPGRALGHFWATFRGPGGRFCNPKRCLPKECCKSAQWFTSWTSFRHLCSATRTCVPCHFLTPASSIMIFKNIANPS